MRDMNYAEFSRATRELVTKIQNREKNIDLIVGISRGGLPLATHLSNVLDLPLKIVTYSSSEGKGTDQTANPLPDFGGMEGKKVLLVDDLADTGYTLRDLTMQLISTGNDVVTATIFHKKHSHVVPHYTFESNMDSDEWCVFPWEK